MRIINYELIIVIYSNNFHERTVIGFEAHPPTIPPTVGRYAARHITRSLSMNAHFGKVQRATIFSGISNKRKLYKL
jgi:hypothetical protein